MKANKPKPTMFATPVEPAVEPRVNGLKLPAAGKLRESILRGNQVMAEKFADWQWAVRKGHPRIAARLWRELNGLPDPEPMPAELIEYFRQQRSDAKERGEE